MKSRLRAAVVRTAYGAIASGVRVPQNKLTREFDQWGRLMDLLAKLEVNVFLDVGANLGFYAQHLRMSGFRGQIISFEPIPETHAHILRLAAGDRDWSAHCLALGAENGTKAFNLINSPGDQTFYSSFLAVKSGVPGETRSVQIEVRRLDQLLPRLLNAEDPRIFLKMDTQGYDLSVFEGASGCMDAIVGLQSELSVEPLYEGMPHYTEALEQFESRGFRLADLFVVNRTASGAVLEYDAMMFRESDLRP